MTDFFHSALTADAYMPPDENQYNYDDDIEEEPFYEEPEAEDRDFRYRQAGIYMAEHSHILLAPRAAPMR